MRVAVVGVLGSTGRRLRELLVAGGHEVVASAPEAAVYFPDVRGHRSLEDLESLVADPGCRRLVLRSHAAAYGTSSKTPGLMHENNPSRVGTRDAANHWLEAEVLAKRHPGVSILRFCPILDDEAVEPLVASFQNRWGITLAGRDPNVQFITADDAAHALMRAIESDTLGMLNVAPADALPLDKAFCCAGATRVPVPEVLVPSESEINQLKFNWTISGSRANRVLGFEPSASSVDALREFLQTELRREPGDIADNHDDWGLDHDYIEAWCPWFNFLRDVYWRIDAEGFKNIPSTGGALLVASHRGFMPLDGVMHVYRVLHETGRVLRFLIIPSLLSMPYLSNFLTKIGGVVASQENARRLLSQGNLVGVFPEGIRGAFTPYRRAYKLRNFARSRFAQIAIENQAPIVPVAVVGHAEIFPIIGRIDWGYVTRAHGWPYFPIAPMFPLAPVPIPSKWHVRVLQPVPVDEFRPDDSQNKVLLAEFSGYVQGIIQQNVDDMIFKRKSWFWGKILDGTAPAREAFRRTAD